MLHTYVYKLNAVNWQQMNLIQALFLFEDDLTMVSCSW